MRRLQYLLVGVSCLLASAVPARAATSRVDGTADEVEAAPGRLRLAQAAQAARIDSISPTSARRGETVAITGIGFGGPNVRITVGGIPAQVIAATGNMVSFRIPANVPGGPTTVTATNPGGHTGSIGFRVLGQPPLADAGPDQLVTVQTTVELDGGGSRDPDGDPLTFRWSFVTLPARSRATLSDPTAMRPSFIIDLPGRYVVRLVVNDGIANSQPDTVVIDTHGSQPVADAGPDQIVLAGDRVELDGDAAVDPDRTLVAFGWAFFSVPNGSQAALSDPAAARPSFVADLPGAYVLHLIVNDMSADSAPDAVIVTAGLTALPGAPGDAANAHIPDIRFPAARPEEFTAASGIPISRTTLGVFFRDTTTVSAANSLIASLNGQIIGGEPLLKMLLLSIPESLDLSTMMAILEQLNARQEVAVAAPNALGVSRALPPHHEDQVGNGWTWDRGIPPLGTNYGLELIRAPQAWNLMTYGLRHGGPADVGIIDLGFDAFHPDLAPRLRYETWYGLPGPADDHGTHVSGIMAATWGNQLGVEGVAPHGPAIIARVYNHAGLRPGLVTASSLEAAFLQDLQTLYLDILAPHPNVVAVNESFGLPCYDTLSAGGLGTCGNPAINPQMTPVPGRGGGSITFAQLVNWLGDAYHAAASVFAATTRSNFLIPAAVGYDSQPSLVRVQDDSPMSNAAVRFPNGHYIAVEAVDAHNAYNPANPGNPAQGQFSFNLGGTVSAPGYGIRSAEIAGGTNFDSNPRFACAFPGDGDLNYATCFGTSQATPYVTGLIAYLWHLDPTLRVDQVRTLITDPAYTVQTQNGTRPRIDAFSAAMGIDILQVNTNLQEALVDVDDGTPDGNYREIRDDMGARVGDYVFVNTADRRRGDGKINMADFRAFRDALVQALVGTPGGPLPADVSLDGSPTHYKFDLNFDGCVGNQVADPASRTVPMPHSCAHAPNENVFPRYDFNGDGQISASDFVLFKGSLLTDLEVLQNVWPLDPTLTEGWTAADLPMLVPGPSGGGSGDVEIRTHLALGATSTIDMIQVTSPDLPQMMRFLTPADACMASASTCIVWTVPVDRDMTFKAEGLKGGHKVSDLCFNRPMRPGGLRHGEDWVVTVSSCEAGPTIDPRFTHFRAEQSWDSSGSASHPVLTNVPYDFQNFSGISCPRLAVSETCQYLLNFPGEFSIGALVAQVTRLGERQFLLNVATTVGATVPPLMTGPLPCGVFEQFVTTTCDSRALSAPAVRISLPTFATGNLRLEISCFGLGGFAPGGANGAAMGFELEVVPSVNLGPCARATAFDAWSRNDQVLVDLAVGPHGLSVGLRFAAFAVAHRVLDFFPENSFSIAHVIEGSITVLITLTPLD